MKITAEFDSNEELLNFLGTFGGAKTVVPKVTTTEGKTEKPIKETKQVASKKIENKEEPKKDKAPKENTAPKDNSNENKDTGKEETQITKEMVRAVFTKLIKAGKAKEAKTITQKYGAKRLPELKEKDFPAVYKEVEALL